MEEGGNEALEQLLVKHAVHPPAIDTLPQQGSQGFPRHLSPRQPRWTDEV